MTSRGIAPLGSGGRVNCEWMWGIKVYVCLKGLDFLKNKRIYCMIGLEKMNTTFQEKKKTLKEG